MHRKILISLSAIVLAFNTVFAQSEETRFKGWENLKNESPEWFKDAKFGIYFHWGVYTVPAFNSEWYSRGMYIPGSRSHQHHLETYGSPEKFGYKDFIPLFNGEKFDPDEWVDLFVKAGAKFAGPVAEHADGFSMWDSRINKWNAKNMGPRTDAVAAMEQAARKRNLKFITTFHHQWHWGWYPTFDSTLDAGNPKFSDLYGPLVSPAVWKHEKGASRPDDAFCDVWLGKVKEVVENYKPDILYFDSRLGHIEETYRKEMVQYYLNVMNHADRNGMILYKHQDLPENVGVRNLEKSRMNAIEPEIWQTEEPISTYSWGYTQDMILRPVSNIIHSLVDVVSKNGVYLLNISPRADGSVPEAQKEILLKTGEWLNRYGEAIYNTRPWLTYGEGPRIEAEEKNTDQKEKYFERSYTSRDIRYTKKKDAVYAIFLGQPNPGEQATLKAFADHKRLTKCTIQNVSLLGSEDPVKWEQRSEGLVVSFPDKRLNETATVIKISTKAE